MYQEFVKEVLEFYGIAGGAGQVSSSVAAAAIVVLETNISSAVSARALSRWRACFKLGTGAACPAVGCTESAQVGCSFSSCSGVPLGQVRCRVRVRASSAPCANNARRYFFEQPVSLPNFVQVSNTHFAVLIKLLIENTSQMVGSESRTQLLLKFRFALHLLIFVNEDSRLLILKLANIEAGLK